jgi:hypothetical protein
LNPEAEATLEAMAHSNTFDPYQCTGWQEKCRQRVSERADSRSNRWHSQSPLVFPAGGTMPQVMQGNITPANNIAASTREGIYAIVALVRDPDLPLTTRVLLSSIVDDAVALRRAHLGETVAQALTHMTDRARTEHCGRGRGLAIVGGRPYFDSRRRQALALCRSLRYTTL